MGSTVSPILDDCTQVTTLKAATACPMDAETLVWCLRLAET
jgi:hypothetical protein